MKKLLFIAAIAVFGLTNTNAQDVKFGLKAGVNFATIAGDDSGGIDSRTAFHAGGMVEIMISDKFAFQPELLYSAQGFQVEGIDAKIDYLNVPLMAKFFVAEGFSLEVGPQVGFLVSAKVGPEDVKDFVKGIDFGVNAGLGYQLDNGLNFSARYNLGLSNINDGEGSDDIKNQNGVFQISVGFLFQ